MTLTHTLAPAEGGLYTGQSCYGDLSLHLGLITSTATQGFFPPEYSILPGVLVSYPFLCDTVSSSLYLLGSSLRVSYMLPMFWALANVFVGMYLFSMKLLANNKKAALAALLFFVGGGFGFA